LIQETHEGKMQTLEPQDGKRFLDAFQEWQTNTLGSLCHLVLSNPNETDNDVIAHLIWLSN
jgi:hypothetical protein